MGRLINMKPGDLLIAIYDNTAWFSGGNIAILHNNDFVLFLYSIDNKYDQTWYKVLSHHGICEVCGMAFEKIK
jgi:hypothetical protein